MNNPTVNYSGTAHPVDPATRGVDWTNYLGDEGKGLHGVRSKFQSIRGDHVLIRSNRSGAQYAVPKDEWVKSGGTVPA